MDNRDEIVVTSEEQAGPGETILDYTFSNKTVEGKVLPDVLYVRTTLITPAGIGVYKRLCWFPFINWQAIELAQLKEDENWPEQVLQLYQGHEETGIPMPILALQRWKCSAAVRAICLLSEPGGPGRCLNRL